MVGPAVKRDAVAHLRGVLEMSERRACSLVAADRKMIRYRSRRPPDTGLRARLHELANQRAPFRLSSPVHRDASRPKHMRPIPVPYLSPLARGPRIDVLIPKPI